MGKPKITLYVDIVSPFAYMGYYMLRQSPVFKQCDITYVPIFLGGLMKACGNRPPIEIKNKDKWIGLERLRWATQFQIPITKTMPKGFPVLTLHTQRALCALELQSATSIPAALDALYHAFWVECNADIGKPDTFIPVLEAAIGKDLAASVASKMGSAEAKKRLSENTDAAFNGGAFGLPWFECENAKGEKDSFWGFDHLGQVVRFLELEQKGEGGELRALL